MEKNSNEAKTLQEYAHLLIYSLKKKSEMLGQAQRS